MLFLRNQEQRESAYDYDGNEVVKVEVTPASDGSWTWTFENLPKYLNGEEITYTVVEDAVAEYTTTYSGMNVTNTHTTTKISVNGTKTWDDENDKEGL